MAGNETDEKTGNEIDGKTGNEINGKTGNEKRRIIQLVKIISIGQLSFAEIQKKLKLKGRDNVRRKGQKYYLTEKGMNLLNFIS